MSCARCGCGVYKTEEFISLNKVWHKYCFTCFQCNKRLDKDSAKVFQGELFCDCCYSCVIEKLFEVISTPAVNKPCKVVSTPSCAISKTFEPKLKNCVPCVQQTENCTCKDFCCPPDKKDTLYVDNDFDSSLDDDFNDMEHYESMMQRFENKKISFPRNVQSCSCIPTPNFTTNKPCVIFPIPREVANYYSRSHMKTKICCNPQQKCPGRKCQKPCCVTTNEPIEVQILSNQCCCGAASLPKCRTNLSKPCCCPKPPAPCTPVFTKPCSCCIRPKSECCELCLQPQSCTSPCSSSCHTCQYCQEKSCKPKCPLPCCCYCQSKCCPAVTCSPPTKCRPPVKSCLPPSCPPVKWCPPQQTSSPKRIECHQQSRCENPRCCLKKPARCYCRPSKYCICGNLNPCNCKMSQIRTQCTVCCSRCGQKVYAAEKVLVSSGAYHTSCFTCFCCNKCLDVKNVFEGCGEIYCKHCYDHFFGMKYYGFGGQT